jgi:SSS family solute:Na+ symporter
VFVQDCYRKLRPDAPDRRLLFIGKVVVALCGATAVGIAAVIASRGERVLSLYYVVSSIISGGLAGLFLLAFLSRRANKQGLWIGIIASLVFTAWATLTSGKNKMFDLGGYNYLWPQVMIGVIAHLLVLVLGYFASFLFPADTHLKQEWTLWGWLETRKTLTPAEATSPAPEP